MVSRYNDPNVPKVAELAIPGPDETRFYTGTVQWDKYHVQRNGRLAHKRVRNMEIDDFESFREECERTEQLCGKNHVIRYQHISASIARQIEKRKERIRVPVPNWPGRPSMGTSMKYVMTNKLVVVHVNQGDVYGDSN